MSELSLLEHFEAAAAANGDGDNSDDTVTQNNSLEKGDKESPEVSEESGKKPDEDGDNKEPDKAPTPDDESEEDEDKRPTAKEARAWRAERRRKQAELKKERDELTQERAQVQAFVERLKTQNSKWIEAEKLKKSGDILGALEALGWDPSEINEAAIDEIHGKDPEVKRLKAWKREQEQAAQREREQREEQRRIQEQRAEEQYWNNELIGYFKRSSNPAIQEIADYPVLVNMIRQAQVLGRKDLGSTPRPVEALKRYILPRLQEDYKLLRSLDEKGLFGSKPNGTRDTASPEALNEQSPGGRKAAEAHKAGRRPKKPLTTTNSAEAAAPGKKRSRKEWLDHYARELELSDE